MARRGRGVEPTRRALLLGAAAGWACDAPAAPVTGARPPAADDPPLWAVAASRGIAFGSALASWQLDPGHRGLHAREAAVLLTEDDLLWYRVKPRPRATLRLERAERVVAFAERHHQLTVGAHLIWDEGFGPGWAPDDLWGLRRREAHELLFGVVGTQVDHFRGRMAAWIVANEVTGAATGDRHGLRTDVPWYATLGPGYVEESFHLARCRDPRALLLINEFGFETPDRGVEPPAERRRAFLATLDHLLDRGAPVDAVGIQGHLLAADFHARFEDRGYRDFLGAVAARGLPILITELDVLDRGLPADRRARDRDVAEVYRHYLDVTLDEPAVAAVIAFGLTDRYSWLDEDLPRADGLHRRPLAFDRGDRPKPARRAIAAALRDAPRRSPLWGASDAGYGPRLERP